ncbi:MAG: hypothetical protein ACI4KH_08865 [Oscillospiraceae bacterium]
MKKALIVILALIACTALAACTLVTGENETPVTVPQTETPTETTPEETTAETSETAAVTPAVNLREFDKKLSDMKFKDAYYMDLPEFFNEEQGEAFANAHYIVSMSSCSTSLGLTPENGTVPVILNGDQPYDFYRTGVSYESFEKYIRSIFTDELAESFFLNDYYYQNLDGELICGDGARGSNIFYVGRTFELISSDEKELKFTLTAHYSAIELYSEEEYNKLPDNEKEWSETFTYSIVNTENGWRVAQFSLWL